MTAVPMDPLDTDAVPVTEAPEAVKRPDLTLDMVHTFLRHISDALDADAETWQRQLACTPRGADFDLRGVEDTTALLDQLAMTGDALGEAIARGDAAAEIGQGVLPHLASPLDALAERRETAKTSARRQHFIKRYGAVLNRLEDDVSSVGRSMSDLSGLAARGAARLNPDASRRILSRMRNLGDATMRLIEDRIASTGTREEGKRLRALRDDLKAWIEERNARLEKMQAVVDELNIRSNALRNECLVQAKRLAAASAIAGRASRNSAPGASPGAPEQASPEALVLSALLRAVLLESRTDVTAPLR